MNSTVLYELTILKLKEGSAVPVACGIGEFLSARYLAKGSLEGGVYDCVGPWMRWGGGGGGSYVHAIILSES